jgi:transposase
LRAKLYPAIYQNSETFIAEGRSVKEVAKTFGVHKATLYRATASQATSLKAEVL